MRIQQLVSVTVAARKQNYHHYNYNLLQCKSLKNH